MALQQREKGVKTMKENSMRRYSPLNKIGRRGRLNKVANARLKQAFIIRGITRCEICGSGSMLSFAHRQKRVNYRTVEELSNFKEVLLLCIPCHQKIEYDKELTNYWFNKLR